MWKSKKHRKNQKKAKQDSKDLQSLGNQDQYLATNGADEEALSNLELEARLETDQEQSSVQEPHQAPLIQHLVELRQRLVKSILFLLLIFVALVAFSRDLYSFIAKPLTVFLPQGEMIATEVASPFLAPFKLSFFAAFLVSMPFILFQLWRFVAPALYKNEKRFAVPLLISSIFLFYLGIAFAYFVVFPLIFGFFTSIAPDDVKVMTDINSYLNFILKLFFAFGLTFEIPIATTLLVLSNLVTLEKLAEKRSYIIVGCFVIGMLLTPPDIFSQSLLAIPMWLLFELGLLNVKLLRFLAKN